MLVGDPFGGSAPLQRRSTASTSLSLRAIMVRGYLLLAAAASGLATAQIGSWTATESIPERSYHSAHLLGNGKVLVVGGGPSETLLYNPSTGTWAATLNQPDHGCCYHAGETLASGKVLIAGGGFLAEIADARLYDPNTNLWSPTGTMAQGRYWHSSVRLANGKVLVMGGKNAAATPLAGAEVYDPATGLWTATGNMGTPRYLFPAVLLNNGKVLVAGGYTGNNTMLASAELYDPATGTWTATGALGDIVAEGRMVKLNDGRILIAGGKDAQLCTWDVEIYNPANGTWSQATRMRHARGGYHTLTLMPDGNVLAIGGIAPTLSDLFNSAELYDPVNNVWTLTAPLADEHAGHTATLLPNGQVLVTGGFSIFTELYRSQVPRAITDFNGDGKSDIVFERGAGTRWLYRMNGAVVQSTAPLPGAAPGWSLAGMGDFDGNNSVDLLWRNDAAPAQHWIYLMANQTIIGSAPLTVGAGYRATYIADFNADGKADIVWENNANGRWLYSMNGTVVSAAHALPGAAAGYKLVGVGDFNGDARADLLWQNALSPANHYIYLMSGNAIIGGGAVAVALGHLPTRIADFNGDGRDDILWENRLDSRWFYFMNGASVLQSKAAPGAALGWSVVGAADFDNNGSADLLWQHGRDSTEFWIHLMSSGVVTGGGPVSVGDGYLPLTR